MNSNNSSDLLFGTRLKIGRAKHHFGELIALVDGFNERKPYRTFIDEKSEPGYDLYRVKVTEDVPREWGGVVGDIVHNLRSSLDNLATALVQANGRTGRKTLNDAEFPIGSSEELFEKSLARRLKSPSPRARQLVQRLKPYKGGIDAFWRLHRLDNLDKHTAIIPVGCSFKRQGHQFGPEMFGFMAERMKGMEMPTIWIETDKPIYPLKDGDILTRYDRASDPDRKQRPNFYFVFSIAFGEGQIVDGQPLLPSLQQLIDFVERVIDIFDRRVI